MRVKEGRVKRGEKINEGWMGGLKEMGGISEEKERRKESIRGRKRA